MTDIRMINEKYIYSITQRAVDRAFLFKPDVLTANIVGACAARAIKKFPVKLYWLDYNINHEHMGIGALSEDPKDLSAIVRFRQLFHRLLASEVNVLHKREGTVFGEKAKFTACLDNESTEHQFFYGITNPVKDNLIDKIAHWKGFSSYPYLGEGKDPLFTYLDQKKFKTGKNKNIKSACMKNIRLHFTPIPSIAMLPSGKRESYIRRGVRLKEQEFRTNRILENKKVISAAKLAKIDPRARPETNKPKTKKPECFSVNPERKIEYIDTLKLFIAAYKEASKKYLSGDYYTEFPKGSLKPPLIVVTG